MNDRYIYIKQMYSIEFDCLFSFCSKPVTCNNDSQAETVKNSAFMVETNLKPVPTPSQMINNGTHVLI